MSDDEDATSSPPPASSASSAPPASSAPNVLSYRQPTSGDRVVTLATFTNSFEANLVMSKLQAEGVPCTLAGDDVAVVIGAYGPGFGKIDVNVVECDLPRAKEVLESIAAAQSARRDANASRDVPCPKCGSTDTKRRLARGWVAMIVIAIGVVTILLTSDIWLLPMLLIAGFLVWTTDKTRTVCRACRHVWVHRPQDDEAEGEYDDDDDVDDTDDDDDDDATEVSEDVSRPRADADA